MTLHTQLTVLLFGMALIGMCARAVALEPEDVLFFKFGPLSIRPQFGLAETYNDNILYSSSEAQIDDLITIVSPGVKLQLGRPEHNFLSLGYTFDQLIYAENSALNAGQHTIELRNQFELQRVRLIGSDRIQLLSNPLGGVIERVIGPDGVATVEGRNVDRLVFEDQYTLSYDLGEKTGVYVRGGHSAVDYEEGIALYDIETLNGTLGFAYRAFPKTVFFGEGYYGLTTTTPSHPILPGNPDLNSFGAYIGVRGNFTAKLSGVAKVGYEFREFSDGESAPSQPVVDLSLTQRFSEKRALSLAYARQNSVSVQYSRQAYTVDTVGVQFSQVLGPSRKWQAGIGGSYSLYTYEDTAAAGTGTEYNYLRAQCTLAYQIRSWLTAQLGYNFERVSGDEGAVIDYDVNRVTLRVGIGF